MSQTETPPGAYDRALERCSREAAATLAAAVATTVFFWGALLLTAGSTAQFFGLPLWFLVSVVGGYFFSIAAVLWIVKRVFRDVPLDLRPDDDAGEAAR